MNVDIIKLAKKKPKRTTNIARIGVFTFFVLYSVAIIFMLVWAVLASFNEHNELLVNNAFIPSTFHFENYLKAFETLEAGGVSYINMIWNSIWFVGSRTFISMATITCGAYALGRYKFTGRKVIMTVLIVCMMIPVYGTGSATLIMYNKLHFYNSPLFVFASTSILGTTVLVVMTFFQSMSDTYEEAAKIDGANKVQIFLSVYLPMVLPSVSAIAINAFINGWNDYMTTLYYMPDFPTLATGLYVYEQAAKYTMDKPVFFSGVIMCAIPPLVLFAVFSDKIMKNVSIGGIK